MKIMGALPRTWIKPHRSGKYKGVVVDIDLTLWNEILEDKKLTKEDLKNIRVNPYPSKTHGTLMIAVNSMKRIRKHGRHWLMPYHNGKGRGVRIRVRREVWEVVLKDNKILIETELSQIRMKRSFSRQSGTIMVVVRLLEKIEAWDLLN